MTQIFKGKWAYLRDELVCVRGDQNIIIAFGRLHETDEEITKLLPYTGGRSTPIKNRLMWVERGKPYGIDGSKITSIEPTTGDHIQIYINDFNRYGEAQENGFLISELENKTKLGDMQKDKSRKVGL